MKKVLLSLLLSLTASVSLAQNSAPLDELVAPFALYPDDLLALVLQASAYPSQVGEASLFLEAQERNAGLQPDGSWDDSVMALLNYPEIIDHLNRDPGLTEALGFAVIDRERAVLDAIQAFRRRALAAGNLVSDDYQQVRVSDDAIEIVTRTPEEVRIPHYEPAEVIVRQPRRVYHYYDYPRPVYYYPYPDRHYFSSGFFFGLTTAYTIGWRDHGRYIRHYNHRRPAHFRRPYARNFFYSTRHDRDRRLRDDRHRRDWQHDARRDGRNFRGDQRRDRRHDGRRADQRDQRRDALRGDRKPQVVIDRYPRREQPTFRGRDQRPDANRPPRRTEAPRRANNDQRRPRRTEPRRQARPGAQIQPRLSIAPGAQPRVQTRAQPRQQAQRPRPQARPAPPPRNQARPQQSRRSGAGRRAGRDR